LLDDNIKQLFNKSKRVSDTS